MGRKGKALFKLIAAAHRHPCDLGSESIDQLTFLFEQALRDQNGHRHILVSGLFELGVHQALHVLPDGEAIGAQDGEALDAGVLNKLHLAADVGIPLGKIVLQIRDLFYLFLSFAMFMFSLSFRIEF